MDIALGVKLLSVLSGLSFAGMVGAVLYKILTVRQFKKLEREGSQVVTKVKARIDHLMAHDADGLVEDVDAEREADPEDLRKVQALLEGVQDLILNGSYEDAERHLVSALGIDPHHEDVNGLLAFVYIKQDRLTKAESVYLDMVARGTSDPTVYGNLGKVLEDQGKLDAAVEAYREAIVKDPKEPKRYTQLAEVYVKQEQPDLAIPLMEEALRLDPEHEQQRMYLVDLYDLVGDEDRQIVLLKELIAHNPSHEEAKRRLAVLRG